MPVNKSVLILFSIAILVQIFCGHKSSDTVQRTVSVNVEAPPQVSPASQEAADNDHIQYLITLLSSDDEGEGNKAQNELISLAEKSSQTRKAVIDKLIISAENLDLENRMILDAKTFRFWSSVSQIFSRLQAPEGLDLLIKYIYLNNGMASEKYYNRPAEGALASMKNISIPKLSEALLHNDKPIIRGRIAILLGNISGPEAKRALEQAKQVESDSSVRYKIKRALSTIARESLID